VQKRDDLVDLGKCCEREPLHYPVGKGHRENKENTKEKKNSTPHSARSCKMSIYLQNFMPIQPRTSLLKFGDLAAKSGKSTVLYLSTKLDSEDHRADTAHPRGDTHEMYITAYLYM
jgi:hypothetical protein